MNSLSIQCADVSTIVTLSDGSKRVLLRNPKEVRLLPNTPLEIKPDADGEKIIPIPKQSHNEGGCRGENHCAAKLTDEKVREMRRRYNEEDELTVAMIAKEYGISVPNAYFVLHRMTWKHVA